MDPRYKLILFGATGFTGRLVAEYLHARANGDFAWALAGRSIERLERVRDELGIGPAVGSIVADAQDPQALADLTCSARVVISTVGPYQQHGDALVDACARNGCDYVDLCGEPGWMARKIRELQQPAAASGARIVFSCGFDSIPFDLGVIFLQHEASRTLGAPLVRVHARVTRMKGGFSGGTAASLIATVEAASRDPALRDLLADPFALVPGFAGPPQPDDDSAQWDELAQTWTAPFVMATINSKNVHRTHALLGHPWGKDFVYSERTGTGNTRGGARRARRLARLHRLQNTLLALAPTRALIRRFMLPRPGDGPGRAQREAGHYEVRLAGETADGRRLHGVVAGRRDPGYGSTSRLIAESALCLADEIDRTTTPGGVWTPGAAMGLRLLPRLRSHAELRFSVGGHA